MKKHITIFLALVSFSQVFAQQVPVDLASYDPSNGILVAVDENILRVEWPAAGESAFMEFRIQPTKEKKSMRPQAAMIQAIGISENGNEVPIFKDLTPEYAIFLGERDLEKRHGWQVFFDYPYQKPYQVQKAVINMSAVTVSSVGQRTTLSFSGLEAGEFKGSLDFTFYSGSALAHMEAALATDQEARAYLYHAGLSTLSDQPSTICWQNGKDEFVQQTANHEFATPKTTRFRAIIAESETGSVATFAAPHRFLPPLDGVGNYGYNWSGQNYLDMFNGYGWGVRQPIFGDRRQVPWLNAPPVTVQKMGMFLYVNNSSAENTLEAIKKFTHGDRFVDIPGYKKFTSHYHVEHSLDFIRKQKEQNTTGIPTGLENPEFVQFFKKIGIDIVHLGEFHNGRTPGLETTERLAQLQTMHEECERLSTKEFLLLPGEEPNVHLGGHWMSFFPKPVYWVLNKPDSKPFVEKSKEFGKVYHVGSQEDVLELFEKENGLMWVAHARIKGSTGYPDAYKEMPFFKSSHYLGAAWKHMPADLSEENMGSRVLGLLDDMSNWGAGKQVIGEVDVFDIQNDYELYGAMNVNYIKLEELPKFEEGWQPVSDALRNGEFFVSTGEVYFSSFAINGVESGGTLKRKKGLSAQLEAQVDWTFPLNYMEVVSGDGSKVYRKRIDLKDTKAFGSKKFTIGLDLKDKDWVRFEVWDVAANGAFTQPVWVRD
ncbi:MAG: hypothetical protein RIG77_08445 [Cyclobacteriaceae bacterium]